MKNKRIDYLNRYIDKSFLVFMSLNFLRILIFYYVINNNEMYKFWMYYLGTPNNVDQDPSLSNISYLFCAGT